MKNAPRLWTASLRQGWPLYFVVVAVFGLGILLGSLGAHTLHMEQVAEMNRHLQSFLSRVAEMDVERTQMARGALYDNLLVGIGMYVLGLTIICLPLMLAFIFIRGFVLGFTVGFLTAEHQLRGLLIIVASMLPHNIFFIPALIIGGTASLSFSILLIKRFFNSQTRVWPGFVNYTLVMAGMVAAFALAALAEAYVTPEITRLVASLLAVW